MIKYEVASLDAASKERVLKKMNSIERLKESLTVSIRKSLEEEAKPGENFSGIGIASIATPVLETTTEMAGKKKFILPDILLTLNTYFYF